MCVLALLTPRVVLLLGCAVVLVAGFQVESPLVRLLRALPVIRLVRGASRLRVVFDTLIYSLPSMTNVGILLFVVYFIYSVVGMQSMGKIVFQSRSASRT